VSADSRDEVVKWVRPSMRYEKVYSAGWTESDRYTVIRGCCRGSVGGCRGADGGAGSAGDVASTKGEC
jgi:hypothetical protein